MNHPLLGHGQEFRVGLSLLFKLTLVLCQGFTVPLVLVQQLRPLLVAEALSELVLFVGGLKCNDLLGLLFEHLGAIVGISRIEIEMLHKNLLLFFLNG